MGDVTICYQCGGGIMNWDCEEDPKEIHRLYYPQCSNSKVDDQSVVDNPQKSSGSSSDSAVVTIDRMLIKDLPIAQVCELINYAF